MKCFDCNADGLQEEIASAYRYQESGLPNVVLQGVRVRRCPHCGAEFASVPKVSELHRVLATVLIEQPGRLTGEEVRFLRKSLGWSGADFSRMLHTDPETVSRWENNKKPMSVSNELLLRVLVAMNVRIHNYEARLDQVDVEAQRGKKPSLVRLHQQGDHWLAAA